MAQFLPDSGQQRQHDEDVGSLSDQGSVSREVGSDHPQDRITEDVWQDHFLKEITEMMEVEITLNQ